MRTLRTMSISSAKVTASAMALRAVSMMPAAESCAGVGEELGGVAVGPVAVWGVGEGKGDGVGIGVAVGVGIGVAVGVGEGVVVGVLVGDGVFVGRGVGVGSGSSPHAPRRRAAIMDAATRDAAFMARGLGSRYSRVKGRLP